MLNHTIIKVTQSTKLSFIPSLKCYKIVEKPVIDFYSNSLSVYAVQPFSKKINKDCNQLQILVEVPQMSFVEYIDKNSNEIDIYAIGRQIIQFSRIAIINLCLIELNNCFLSGNIVKVFIKELAKNQKQFIERLKEVLFELVKTNKSFAEQVKSLNTMREIDVFYEKLRKRQEKCYSIQNLYKSKLLSKSYNKNITLSESDIRWILQVIEKPQKKLQIICRASQLNFNASEIHKLISLKEALLYVLFTKTHIVAFYSAIKYKPNSEIFGNYYGDPSHCSKLLSVTHKTIHNLFDEKKSVGYTKQCLIVIGEIDIVITNGNIENICEFPKSYKVDQQDITNSAQRLIGGSKFILEQMDIYYLTDIKHQPKGDK